MPQFVSTFRGTHIVVTPDLILKVLHVPRVVHPDYPSCERLRTVSRDDLLSHFYGTPSIWRGKLNTLCLGIVKGLRFLNMVMTFAFTPLSHYNSITKPCACFLLSFSLSDRLHYGTQTMQIYSGSEPSSRFRFFFFFYSSRTLSYLVP